MCPLPACHDPPGPREPRAGGAHGTSCRSLGLPVCTGKWGPQRRRGTPSSGHLVPRQPLQTGRQEQGQERQTGQLPAAPLGVRCWSLGPAVPQHPACLSHYTPSPVGPLLKAGLSGPGGDSSQHGPRGQAASEQPGRGTDGQAAARGRPGHRGPQVQASVPSTESLTTKCR